MRNVGDIINVNKCAAIEEKLCQIMGALGESNNMFATLTAPTWLVWSNEHGAWWGPSRCDYVSGIEAAGRYSLEEAMEISRLRSLTKKSIDSGNPSEMIQPSPEWLAARDAFIAKATGGSS